MNHPNKCPISPNNPTINPNPTTPQNTTPKIITYNSPDGTSCPALTLPPSLLQDVERAWWLEARGATNGESMESKAWKEREDVEEFNATALRIFGTLRDVLRDKGLLDEPPKILTADSPELRRHMNGVLRKVVALQNPEREKNMTEEEREKDDKRWEDLFQMEERERTRQRELWEKSKLREEEEEKEKKEKGKQQVDNGFGKEESEDGKPIQETEEVGANEIEREKGREGETETTEEEEIIDMKDYLNSDDPEDDDYNIDEELASWNKYFRGEYEDVLKKQGGTVIKWNHMIKDEDTKTDKKKESPKDRIHDWWQKPLPIRDGEKEIEEEEGERKVFWSEEMEWDNPYYMDDREFRAAAREKEFLNAMRGYMRTEQTPEQEAKQIAWLEWQASEKKREDWDDMSWEEAGGVGDMGVDKKEIERWLENVGVDVGERSNGEEGRVEEEIGDNSEELQNEENKKRGVVEEDQWSIGGGVF